MASRTFLDLNMQDEKKKKRTPSKRLRDTTAVIYNYIKTKLMNSRSATKHILFQQACSVTKHFSTSDRIVLLKTAPAMRSLPGLPAPLTKVLKDFEEQYEKFLYSSPLNSSRASSSASEKVEPPPETTDPKPKPSSLTTTLAPSSLSIQIYKEMSGDKISSKLAVKEIPDTSTRIIPVTEVLLVELPSRKVARAALLGARASAKLGATVVGGIALLASTAINWEMPTGSEGLTERDLEKNYFLIQQRNPPIG